MDFKGFVMNFDSKTRIYDIEFSASKENLSIRSANAKVKLRSGSSEIMVNHRNYHTLDNDTQNSLNRKLLETINEFNRERIVAIKDRLNFSENNHLTE